MEKGQIVTLTIEDMSAEGQGIGRSAASEAAAPAGGLEKADACDAAPDATGDASNANGRELDAAEQGGMVVFVRDTVPGDRVRVRLTKVKKRFAFGRVEEWLERSPGRNDAFDCPHFRQGCGGCAWAGMDYDLQIQLKEKQVRDKLQRLAGLEDPVLRPIIGMEEEDNGGQGWFRYRDKAVFPVSTGGVITRKGGVVENLGDPAVGFYRARSHEVVDCGDCYLQSMAAMAAADALRQFMEEDNITAFDPKWEKGLMRHLIVKTAFGTGEVMVILVINGKGIPNGAKLVGMLDEAIAEVGYSLESVVINIHKASGRNVEKNKHKDRSQIRLEGEILGDRYQTIAGKPTITDQVGQLKYEISPASFYQVNPAQMRRLYDQVRRYVAMPARNGAGKGDQETAGSPAWISDLTCETPAASAGAHRLAYDSLSSGPKPVILDLYCGIGSIGLYCADLAEMVVGIESVKEAVTDANRNAVINGIVNARYLCGRAEHVLPEYLGASEENKEKTSTDKELQAKMLAADIAILDPPRAGCRPELLKAVAGAGVGRIIYVSCDPATLARDVRLLHEMGYEYIEATPVDMFPHTGHVETVVLLSRKSK